VSRGACRLQLSLTTSYDVSRRLRHRRGTPAAIERGALAIEGYPITTKKVIDEELHVGPEATFLEAGFAEVSRPTKRRVVMRIDIER
jgi:hypothetical protein